MLLNIFPFLSIPCVVLELIGQRIHNLLWPTAYMEFIPNMDTLSKSELIGSKIAIGLLAVVGSVAQIYKAHQ
jgi:hypothetical protein